jgi:hypothetical protein
VARVGDRTGTHRFWLTDLMEREHLKDLHADRRKLKSIDKKRDGVYGLG